MGAAGAAGRAAVEEAGAVSKVDALAGEGRRPVESLAGFGSCLLPEGPESRASNVQKDGHHLQESSLHTEDGIIIKVLHDAEVQRKPWSFHPHNLF